MQQEPSDEGLNGAVAAELRAEKARRRLTNKALSDLSGIPEVTLQRKLAGERDIRMPELDAIATALGCGAGVIFDRAVVRLSADAELVEAAREGMDQADPEGARQETPDEAVTDEEPAS